MPNLSAGITETITVTELSSSVILTNRAVPGLLNALLTAYDYEAFRQVGNAAPDVVALPGAKVQLIMVRNAGAAGNVTVKVTPQGLAEVTIAVLTPGSMILLMELDTSLGWSSLSLQASAGTIPCEVLTGA